MRNKFVGRLPLSSFSYIVKKVIDERLYEDGGIKPESLLSPSVSIFKLSYRPKASGMCPPKTL